MTKNDLIEELVAEDYLQTPIIVEAFRQIDRADFVPETAKNIAYANTALPIGHGQTISQPLTVAFMLERLAPKTGERVLDIGTGSGWQAALLAYIVSKNDDGGSGKVITVERIPELKRFAEANLKKYGVLESGVVKTVLGNGHEGYSDEAPYDRIIAAAAGSEMPKAWKNQVALGGCIVAPIGQSIYRYERTGEHEFSKERYFGFSFVPLVADSERKERQQR